MLQLTLLCAGLCAAAPTVSAPPAQADLKGYEEARAQLGRDADAHVKLALWCEAHGLSAEKFKHLALAVLTDPQNTTARGLMGLVSYNGKWRSPDAVREQIKTHGDLAAALAEYNARRDGLKDTAAEHWKIALWCESKGLKPEALAHLASVVRLDPGHEAAWKHMGYKRWNGRWLNEDQRAAEKAESDQQRRADRKWRPLLEKWRGWLSKKETRGRAERALAQVTDPRAIPAVWAVFGLGDEAQQTVGVQLLGQIEAPEASRALAVLSGLSPTPKVRKIASETLRKRDPRDFIGLLIALLRDPIKYDVRPVGGVGSPGVLLVEGKQFNLRRFYGPPDPLPRNVPLRLFDPAQPFDPFSLRNLLAANGIPLTNSAPLPQQAIRTIAARPEDFPAIVAELRERQPGARTNALNTVINTVTAQQDRQVARFLGEVQQATAVAQQQLATDLSAIETSNAQIRRTNRLTLSVLHLVTGLYLGEESASWSRWWTDQQGYAYRTPDPTPKPTYDEVVPFPYVPTYARISQSCFGRGTLVSTLDGPRPIESIRVGDRVLSQDTKNGALDFKPVLTVYHNPPSATLRVALGDEAVVATGIHRFWKAGKGWVMARELKPDDLVRTLGGTARVATVETAEVQPVFNLEVGENQSFFVGTQGALVHDNSLVRAVTEPFDTAPELVVAARSAE
jgi:hypothetical protein